MRIVVGLTAGLLSSGDTTDAKFGGLMRDLKPSVKDAHRALQRFLLSDFLFICCLNVLLPLLLFICSVMPRQL